MADTSPPSAATPRATAPMQPCLPPPKSRLWPRFAVKLGVTSVVGNTGFVRYFPAAVCIAIGCIALFSPMLANNIKKEMEQDSAFYARCRGLSEGKILFRYALLIAQKYGQNTGKENLAKTQDLGYNKDEVQKGQRIVLC